MLALPVASDAQFVEVPNFWIDLPPRSTLWAVVAFVGDELVEVTLATRSDSKAARGRMEGKRLAEVSWHNRSSTVERVAVRGKSLVTAQDLPVADYAFFDAATPIVGLGTRPRPAAPADRFGAYPHQAVLFGFVERNR
jgi:hypothetical protein